MQEGNDNEEIRSQLYDRFREALVKPVGERFFEEDELIEIFDYAGDVNDDYVRWEVLFCGERLYPESDGLRARRAIAYRETMPQTDAAGEYLRDNAAGGESVLWQLERTAEEMPDALHAAEALDGLLAAREKWEDEEMIRLVKLASMLGCTDWLLGKEEELRARTDYLPVLLYELGIVLMDSGDPAEAAPFFEELTRLEPFVASYWALSCSVLARLGRKDEAREAFEFASGLEISDPETAVMLAQACMSAGLEDLRPQAVEMLEAAVAMAPDYFRAVSALATLYAADERREDADRVVVAYAEANPRVRETVNLAADLQLPCFGPLFSFVMQATGGSAFSREEVLSGVENLMGEGRFNDAWTLIVVYAENAEADEDMRILFASCSYQIGAAEGVLELYPDAEAVAQTVAKHPRGAELGHVYFNSLKAMERREEAKLFVNKVLTCLREGWDDSDVGRWLMLAGLLREFKEA